MDVITIITTILTIVVAIAQSIIVKKINDTMAETKKKKQDIEERHKAMEDGVMALLGDAIDRQCKLAINETDVDDMAKYIEKIDHLNKPYKALNGNGIIANEIKYVNEVYHDRLKNSLMNS